MSSIDRMEALSKSDRHPVKARRINSTYPSSHTGELSFIKLGGKYKVDANKDDDDDDVDQDEDLPEVNDIPIRQSHPSTAPSTARVSATSRPIQRKRPRIEQVEVLESEDGDEDDVADDDEGQIDQLKSPTPSPVPAKQKMAKASTVVHRSLLKVDLEDEVDEPLVSMESLLAERSAAQDKEYALFNPSSPLSEVDSPPARLSRMQMEEDSTQLVPPDAAGDVPERDQDMEDEEFDRWLAESVVIVD